MTISERIFLLLAEKHLSQKDLAAYIGLSASAVTGWKKKKTLPSSDKLVKICEFLEVSLDYLLKGEEKSFPHSDFVMDSPDDYESGLTEREREIVSLFRMLPEYEKGHFHGMLEHAAFQSNMDE